MQNGLANILKMEIYRPFLIHGYLALFGINTYGTQYSNPIYKAWEKNVYPEIESQQNSSQVYI